MRWQKGLLCSYVFFYAMTKMVWGDLFPKALYNWIIMLISFVLTVFLSYSTSKKFSFTFFQEVLARKVAQETMEEIFVGSRGSIIAIFISSVMFGVLHLHYGFLFMVGCSLYLTVLEFYYRKNRNIWNCVILHLVLGEMFIGFGFAAI